MSDFTMDMHGSVTVWTKWQVVIPVDVRKKLNIQEGDKLMVISKWDIAIGFIKADNMELMLEHLKKECKNSDL